MQRSPERGLLETPAKGTPIIWGEPMIEGVIAEETVLYVNPPLFKKKYYESSGTDNDRHYILTKKYANKHAITQDSHHLIPSRHVLKKGSKILYREAVVPNPHDATMSISPYALEVTTFEPKVDDDHDLPESGRGIEVKLRGFVFKNNVKVTKAEYYREADIKNASIFPKEEQAIDRTAVYQSVFGDCYLLSTILSILSATGGDDFFKKMMRQNKETGLVYVKLFNPANNKPEYVVVKNSLFCEEQDDTTRHKQLWIHMLEKAYAGYGLSLNPETKSISFHHSSFRAIYGSGGKTEVAFQILTGQSAQSFLTEETIEEDTQPFSVELAALCYKFVATTDQASRMATGTEMLAYFKTHPEVASLFNNSILALYDYGKLLKYLVENRPEKYAELTGILSQLDELSTNAKLEDINTLIDFLKALRNDLTLQPKPNDNDKILPLLESFTAKTLAYLRNSKHYVNDESTGEYSFALLEVFHVIRDKLQLNCLMTASTLSDFPEPVPGLRSKHAYALLDVKTTDINGQLMHFIKLRNPWGIIGRVYTWDKDQATPAEDTHSPEFWLELNDFAKYFYKYTICNPVPGLTLDNTLVQQVSPHSTQSMGKKQ